MGEEVGVLVRIWSVSLGGGGCSWGGGRRASLTLNTMFAVSEEEVVDGMAFQMWVWVAHGL